MMVRTSLKEKPLHLFLFPVLFVLNHFMTIVVPEEMITNANYPILLANFIGAIAFCSLLTFLLHKVIRLKVSSVKSAILVTLLSIPFFFFQDFFLSTEELMVGVRLRWLLPVLMVTVLILFFLIAKTKKPLLILNETFNVISIFLVLYVAFTLVVSSDKLKPKSFNLVPKTYDLKCEDCPDIYFLILDSYTSNKSLRNYYSFDNSTFTNELTKIGFGVSDEAISPYSSTGYCVGSILNLNQVKNLDSYENRFGVHELIKKNSVTTSLQQIGYEIKNYSLFDVGDQPKYYSLSPTISAGFVNGIIQNSLLGMIFRFVQDQSFYGLHLSILGRMREEGLQDQKRPRFFYGHIMAPHPPFVINQIGGRVDFFDRGRHRVNISGYIDQLQGLNVLVLDAVRDILKKSPNSIFVIMGDHGYRFINKKDEAFTVFLTYKGPNQNKISTLNYSSQIFDLIFDELVKKK